jgi:xylulokinase
MYLGLDFGTSGARACIVDNEKRIIWERRAAYPTPSSQTPTDWRNTLYALLRELPPPLSNALRGIAIDGTSGTVLLCNAQLEPASPVLLYNDNRAQQQATQLRSIVPAAHSVGTSTSGLAKFLWLTQHYQDAAYFLHQADWLTALLSGQLGISDYHNALKTGYDVENLCWPDWTLALPHSHLLPKVLAPGAVIGKIQPDIAAHFGINPCCLIHAGTTDSTAAFVATETHDEGIGITSLGTTLVLKQLCDHPIASPEHGVYSHRYRDKWLVGGASNAGAGILKYYFNDAQLAALSAQIDPLRDSPLDYYPLPKAGERFPVNDPALQPRLAPRPCNDVEFLHGLLQGLAHIEAAGYAKLQQLGAPLLRSIVTSGGGAKNTVWQAMRSRIIGIPIGRAPHHEAAYGAALLALASARNESH